MSALHKYENRKPNVQISTFKTVNINSILALLKIGNVHDNSEYKAINME